MKKKNICFCVPNAFLERSQSILNMFPMCSLNVPETFSTRSQKCSRSILSSFPKTFPMRSQRVPLSDQKEAPWALLKVHYVSARALVAFKPLLWV
jgi:hypothetical protein